MRPGKSDEQNRRGNAEGLIQDFKVFSGSASF
jgi:hypothetical protein